MWRTLGRHLVGLLWAWIAPRRWAVLAAAVLLVFVLGVLAGRTWWPRVETRVVSRTVERVVERMRPGETRTITRPVYVDRTRVVRVPVEVTRTVTRDREVPRVVERVVTVTMPVEVPVEVVRERWPASITVRVGSVDTREYGWATPANPELVIGMVEPGIYAVPEQPGWKVEQVETSIPEIRISPAPVEQRHWYLYGAARSDGRPLVGLSYQNLAFGGSYEIRAEYVWPSGPQFTVAWGIRW